MRVYLCRLVLHENLYYASREIGRLYETGRCLHNYALTYALGLATAPYFQARQVPRYAEELTPLNQQGIYVTPARGVNVSYAINTFKYASNLYHVEMEKGSRNTPSYGRAKEIATESEFQFAVIAQEDAPLSLPTWIRLGLWRSKAELTWEEFHDPPRRTGQFTAGLPLNPLDVSGSLVVFDIISIPPVSLVTNAVVEGAYYHLPGGPDLPAGMQYTFPA